MTEVNIWDQKLIKEILLHVDFKITEVNEPEVIQSALFKKEKYPFIISLIKNKDWEGLKMNEDQNSAGFREYLYILKFFDQNKLFHVATIYDSDELWQDPEIIDIFPLP